jgi:hypothetical protein
MGLLNVIYIIKMSRMLIAIFNLNVEKLNRQENKKARGQYFIIQNSDEINLDFHTPYQFMSNQSIIYVLNKWNSIPKWS